MKIASLLAYIFVFLSVSHLSQAQSLATYGSNTISGEEFLRAFTKNNSEQKKTEKSIRDYLDLYIRFKLKVKAAYELRLDTLPNQRAEFTEFRRQIAEGFLNDEASFNNLVDEAFRRSQKDIHLAHIFIPTNQVDTAGNRDTLKAWKLATSAYNDLQKGLDFAKVAADYSSDSSVRNNHGDIGYITVFTLPYNLENIVYTTPSGTFSRPVLSDAGYHLFKNLGERKAIGRMKASQILVAFPPGATANQKARVKLTADSIYGALEAGALFEVLSGKYRNTNTNYAPNGEMPEFGVGTYEQGFESAVFALTRDNEVSKPIESSIGYHIVKRIKHIPVNSDPADDSSMAALKQMVRMGSRIEVSKKAMLEKILRVTVFKKAPINEKDLWAYSSASLAGGKRASNQGINDKTLLFSFPRKNIYVGEWIQYLKSRETADNKSTRKNLPEQLGQFREAVSRDYYLNHLEEYDADFAAQLKEFKEGNLLFEVMQRNIWDKASADSIGLRKYFENNKSKYWWEASADALIFNCTDSATAYLLRSTIEKNKDWRNVIAPFGDKVQADSGRFELTQLPLTSKIDPKPGMLTEPLKNASDNNISFLYIVNVHTEKSARSFEDAKGFILSDYQTFLEDKWIDSLKKKYPVKINDSVLRSLWK